MRVLCAHTSLRPKTRAALERYAPQTEFVDVSGDDYAYWRQIALRWGGGEDLLVVEHDIEIHENVIPQLEACSEPWCTFAYKLWNPDVWCYNALGCTRFSASLMADITPGEITQVQAKWLAPSLNVVGNVEYHPEVMPFDSRAACRCGGRGAAPCWQHIDMKIADTIEGRGVLKRQARGAHVHQPPVRHLPVDDPEDWAYGESGATPFEGAGRGSVFPPAEPSRTFHSASLDERPDWWPLRPAGVSVIERD